MHSALKIHCNFGGGLEFDSTEPSKMYPRVLRGHANMGYTPHLAGRDHRGDRLVTFERGESTITISFPRKADDYRE